MLRLHIRWQNCTNPTPEENLYYESCWGKKQACEGMNRVYNILNENRKSIGKKLLEQKAKKLIEPLDYNIAKDVRELRKKYHDLIERHTSICDKMIIETVYPEFIQREVEQIEKNKKTKDKIYPKYQRVFASDVLEFRDSVEENKSTVALYTK